MNWFTPFRAITSRIVSLWRTADEVARNKAVDVVEEELEELEYVFAILCQGSFIGLPCVPAHISMDLLPLMEKDLTLMLDRITTANEPLSRLFSVFDVS